MHSHSVESNVHNEFVRIIFRKAGQAFGHIKPLLLHGQGISGAISIGQIVTKPKQQGKSFNVKKCAVWWYHSNCTV